MSRQTESELAEAILGALQDQEGPVGIRRLLRGLGLPLDTRRYVRRVAQSMVREGRLQTDGRGRYELPAETLIREGTLVCRGRGLVWLKTEAGELYRILVGDRGGALPGDRVIAQVVRKHSRGPSEVRVQEISARGSRIFVGVLEKGPKSAKVLPDDPDIGCEFWVSREEAAPLAHGSLVAVQVCDSVPRARPRSRIVKCLGLPGELPAELARLCVEHGLEEGFPEEVEREVEQTSAAIEARERIDLRSVPLVTIDPADAKDHDDAVYVERQGKGFRLLVSIADVASYVPAFGAVDQEAYRRGCSVYLPGRVFPMLPHRLSSSLCSLLPGQDRRAITVELHLSAAGEVQKVRACRSLIRSAARLTYDDVQAVLDGRSEPSSLASLHEEQLRLQSTLAALLLARMRERGLLELELPESRIVLDGAGRPGLIEPVERHFAHRIVEAFMIAANEAVARVMQELEAPTLYRIHPPPDAGKIELFAKVARGLGQPLPFEGLLPSPEQLGKYLASLREVPSGAALHQLLLRSLMQARYAVSCDGHYGLASGSYLHFTSPIRRYPDLVVHRQLGRALDRSPPPGFVLGQRLGGTPEWYLNEEQAANVADSCSRSERTALEAERAVSALYQAAYALEHVGELFDGVIAFVMDFGLFVRLLPSGVEGFVHISRLRHDHYQYLEDRLTLVGRRTGRSFRIGDKVRARVESAQLSRRQVDLTLVEPDEV